MEYIPLIALALIIGLAIGVGNMQYERPTKAPDKKITIVIKPSDLE